MCEELRACPAADLSPDIHLTWEQDRGSTHWKVKKNNFDHMGLSFQLLEGLYLKKLAKPKAEDDDAKRATLSDGNARTHLSIWT